MIISCFPFFYFQTTASNEFKKTIEDMVSQIKEAEIEMAETEKEKGDFEKEIILNGKSSRTGKIVSERLKKFLELTLKKKDGLIDKLNIQNQALKTAIRKTQNQLHQREEMGETVSKIDFDKFKIESNQMQLKIDRLNNDLMKLKSTTGQVMQVLSTLTNELNDLTTQNESMKKLIEQRKKYSAQLVQEIEKVMKEYKMEKEKNLLLIAKHKEVKVPQILDYVTLKKECDELNVKVKDWERKLQVRLIFFLCFINSFTNIVCFCSKKIQVIQGEKHVLNQKYSLLMKQQMATGQMMPEGAM